MELIGREEEKQTIIELYESNESSFLAIYGRRRVGKTFLVRKTLSDKITFSYSGKANINKRTQLNSFRLTLIENGLHDCPILKDWFEAFFYLKKIIQESIVQKKVIFLDEVAWMDNQKSDFISALEGFWNEWASKRNDILLIICASATSWIIDNVFHNRGGLHNRITHRLRINPFNLSECEEYSKVANLAYSRYQILQLYMAIGGAAWYWSLLKKGYSVIQNLILLFFSEDAPLKGEYKELYSSLFRKPEKYIDIIKALSIKISGLDKQELSAECKISNNSKLTHMLEELEECGFIRKYIPFGKKHNSMRYQLTDCLSLFHLTFLSKTRGDLSPEMLLASNSYVVWCGLAYERVVLNHIHQVKKALGINGIYTQAYTWRSNPSEDNKAQIDLLIDRADSVINLVEVKWSVDGKKYVITKEVEENLLNKKDTFVSQTKTRKSVFITMITLSGIERNSHSDCVTASLTLEDLFN